MPADAASALPSCCATFEDVRRLSGRAVRLHGVYKKTVVSKRPPPVDLKTPGRAAIETEGPHIMLEIYYEEAGLRSLEEIQRFHGKKVVVTGMIHTATPTQTHEGIPMQTMIGPYITVDSIELDEAEP